MPLFRCLNDDCSEAAVGSPEFDFENESGVCPKCNHSNKDAPNLVVVRCAVHYLVNDPRGLIRTLNGCRTIACKPQVKRLNGQYQCTGERTAVTCPDCCKTDAFLQHEKDEIDQHLNIVPAPKEVE